MILKTTTGRHDSRGYSLLELLLAITIFASVLLSVMVLLQTFAQRELARATNRYMMSVLEATKEILSDPTNFNALYEATADLGASGGGYELIADASQPATDNIMKDFTVTSVATGNVTIQATNRLNDQFTDNSPIKSQVRILLRIADNPPPDETDVRALEIFVVTRTPRPDELVQMAATEGGYNGGYIRTYAAKASAVMSNSFNSWRLTLSGAARLNHTNWYTNDLLASLNTDTQGSYLVYYDYVNAADIQSDYLYRVPDPDVSRKLNTMYGSLNLGGNDIVGADDVNIGNATAVPFASGVPTDCNGDVLCVEGMGIVKGSATVGGTMTVTGSALVNDSSSTKTLRIQNGLPQPLANGTPSDRLTYAAQGLFVVDGDDSGGGGGTTDAVSVTGNSTFLDSMTVQAGTLGTVTATTVTMPENGVLQSQRITGADKISASTVQANSMTTNGQLKAGVVQGGDLVATGLTTANARVGIIDTKNMNDLTYGSSTTNKNISVPRLRVEKLFVNNFGTCGDCAN